MAMHATLHLKLLSEIVVVADRLLKSVLQSSLITHYEEALEAARDFTLPVTL